MPARLFTDRRRRSSWARASASALVLLVVSGLLWGLSPFGARAATQDGLRDRIDRGRATESRLQGDAARLARLERIVARGIGVLERRQADAQADLDRATARLASTRDRLGAARRRLADQRRRLDRDRTVLAANLRAAYLAGGTPDLATLLVDAKGVGDAVERLDAASRTRSANARILANVQDARAETAQTERALQRLVPGRSRAAAAVRAERDALASRAAALAERRAALAQTRRTRLAAIRASRSDRAKASRTLARLVRAQQRAAVDRAGPGGPWAIPWAIVQCESGGQNLPPNGAGASGYYQFMPATWGALGGSTSDAYKASKAEQDRLAAKLWAGGAGARNWDCAAIVGLR